MKGEDPIQTMRATSIEEAREKFKSLRASTDFAYWAATSYRIPNISDKSGLVTLVLNSAQNHIIDTILKDLQEGQVGRYVIPKQGESIGVTTVVQAYIIWRQLYKTVGMNSFTASPSGRTVHNLRLNTARILSQRHTRYDRKPTSHFIHDHHIRRKYYMGRNSYAHYTTTNNEHGARSIDISYVHFADMSKTHVDCAKSARRCFTGAFSGVLLQPPTLVVMEGDIPSNNSFFAAEVAASLRGTSLFRLLSPP